MKETKPLSSGLELPHTRHPHDTINIMTHDAIQEILMCWNIPFGILRDDITFYGSPERSKARWAVESKDSTLYVLEKLHEVDTNHKEKVAQVIAFFHDKKLPAVSYIKTQHNTYVVEYKKSHWLLSKFIHNVPLQRPQYTQDAWRGEQIANFLMQLSHTSKTARSDLAKMNIPIFSLKDQIISLTHKISHHDPKKYKKLVPILTFVKEELFEKYDTLPIGFCHGDLHAMNILWGKKNINAVIDWEFLGYKPETYDLALTVGCIGIENPNFLQDDMARVLIQKVRNANIYQEESWKYFLELIIAIRLIWLELWLKNNDTDIVNLELAYIQILIKESKYLKNIWDI
ncbi:MAG: aminoglycoside phosphotransferase family protein [Candidatus Pacebacteria bacterium]|nr:aminoglycoside phosphotransferase family protein [Candidatus Paceibacterota bacterium]